MKIFNPILRWITHHIVPGVIVSVLLFMLGIALFPQVTVLGKTALDIVIAALLLLYLSMYLLKSIGRTSGKARFVIVTESILLAFIAASLILKQFDIRILGALTACQILGIALWLRGVSCVLCGYLLPRSENGRPAVSLPLLAGALALITFGTYTYADPFVDDGSLIYAIAICCLVSASALLACTFAYEDRKTRKKKRMQKEKQAAKDKSEENKEKTEE